MSNYTVLAAKTHLSRLLHDVEAGDEVIITRGDKPVARLVPFRHADVRRPSGTMSFTVPDDFDGRLPETELASWE